MRSRAAAVALAGIAVALAASPRAAVAQAGFVVGGRVVDAESGAGIQNALVTLFGHGATLSSESGVFRFEDVPSAEYPLRVEVLGYVEATFTVAVGGDTILLAPLQVEPIAVEGLDVEARTIDFDGRVRDPRTDSWVFDAHIRSDQGHDESTSLSGRFDLDDVYDGPPIRLVIRGFRYLPLDTTFIPDDQDRYPFDLAPDPLVTRLIGEYVADIDERAGKRLYEFREPLGRDDLARLAPNMSLRMAMERRYPMHILERVGCIMIDEREYRFGSLEERISVLEGTFANELERVELLEFPGYGRMFMVRVYTRWFFQRQVMDPDELDPASMVDVPGGPLCR